VEKWKVWKTDTVRRNDIKERNFMILFLEFSTGIILHPESREYGIVDVTLCLWEG
jgi:hypothetical protein